MIQEPKLHLGYLRVEASPGVSHRSEVSVISLSHQCTVRSRYSCKKNQEGMGNTKFETMLMWFASSPPNRIRRHVLVGKRRKT